MKPGPQNLITDVLGLRVGNAHNDGWKTGTTALICDVENVASVHVMGGAPGARETDLLAPENTVQSVDAFVLSGGSAFGLDAAGGAIDELRIQGKGFRIRDQTVPIVPAAILFDLINGGDKSFDDASPYHELGRQAARSAQADFDLGSVGAGYGAMTGGPAPGLKGGLGSASTVLDNGITIGALVAVNALGAPTVGESPNFWAAPFEQGDEFGGLGLAQVSAEEAARLRIKFRGGQAPRTNTTIGIIATDAKLDKGAAKRLAIAAHDGFARALWPSHTPLDGDLIFSVSTGTSGVEPDLEAMIDLSAAAAATMARAIARGAYKAKAMERDLFPTWAQAFNRD